MHNYYLKNTAFHLIKEGKKTIEGRLNKNSFQKIKINDIINFKNKNDNIYVQVIDIKKYSSFLDMLKTEDIKKITPLSNSIGESLNIYRNCYSKTAEEKYGVLAIKLSVISNNSIKIILV